MTIDEINQRVKAIEVEAQQRDDEAAHALEDSLYRDVLQAFADGRVTHPEATARTALQTRQLDFHRWCA